MDWLKAPVFALLLLSAAVFTGIFVKAAVVSHSPSEIRPQGAGSGLDSDTLQGLSSASILEAFPGLSQNGELVGSVKTTTYAFYGIGCVTKSCTANPPGYCREYPFYQDTCQYGCSNVVPVFTWYTAGCAPGWQLVELSRYSPGTWGTCVPQDVLYSCYKKPQNKCGNGLVEAGEACDDGNNEDDAGNCAADCSRQNLFLADGGGSYYGYVTKTCNSGPMKDTAVAVYVTGSDTASANQYCREKGFTSVASYWTSSLYTGSSYYKMAFNGAAWECSSTWVLNGMNRVWCK